MTGGRLHRGGVALLLAMLAALLAAAGCGSSDNGGITVKTGSLSKAAFIKKANEICEAVHTEINLKFFRFLKTQGPRGTDAKAQQELVEELLDSILAPSVKVEIKRISTLGAPEEYAPEVEDFLNTLHEQLEEAQKNSKHLSSASQPFQESEEAAKQAGLNSCTVAAA